MNIKSFKTENELLKFSSIQKTLKIVGLKRKAKQVTTIINFIFLKNKHCVS
jgi:hypothetical protein